MVEGTAKKRKIAKGRHLSAFKRERQNTKRMEANKAKRSALRTAIKKLRAKPTQENLKTTIPVIDRAASKGIIPKTRASRLISRLTKMVVSQAIS